MTRKEEIHNAAMEVSNRWKRSELLPTQDEIIAYDAAVTMAEWCDSHPKKGLWNAEKVITWIALHAELYGGFNQGKLNSMCEDLRKAIED